MLWSIGSQRVGHNLATEQQELDMNFTKENHSLSWFWGFPGGSVVKNLLAKAGVIRDVGSIPGLGRYPGRGHDNPLQYPCLENSLDREIWWATVHRVAKESQATEST